MLAGEKRNLETGIEAMRKLASGKVHLGVRAGAEGEMASLKGAEIHTFAGKHPVGNVGVQIHHVDPINKDERVWTVNIQDLAIIGRLLNEGRVDRTKVIAVAGSEVKNPQYYRLIDGAPVASVLKDNLNAHGPQSPHHFGQRAYGTQDPGRRFHRFLCKHGDGNSRRQPL